MRSLRILIGLLLASSAFAQAPHILPCRGASDHESKDCFGWATGRSFGRSSNDPVCTPYRLQGRMDTAYFRFHQTTNQGDLLNAAIVAWGDGGVSHVAFKESTGVYTHVLGVGGELLSGTFADICEDAEPQYGQPTGYFEELLPPRQRNILVKNVFADNSNGGQVRVDGSLRQSGTVLPLFYGTYHTVTREPGQVSNQGIKQKHDYWTQTNQWRTNDTTWGFWVIYNDSVKAYHKNLYNVQFQYSKPTGTFGGSIVVNGQTYTTPTNLFEVMQEDSISASASTYFEFENVGFHFSTWSPTGSTNTTSKFGPGGTSQLYTVTANFSPIPKPPANLTAGGNVGDPVRVTWTSHSASSGVTEYQIWRKVKPKNQQEGTPQLLTTVPRTTTSYTDNAYTVTSGYTDDLVSYDVRARYNAGGVSAYANPNYVSVFAAESWKVAKQGKSVTSITTPTAFSLSAQPNPFNPSTQIVYEVPEPASVRIEIFDVTGRRLTELVNSENSSGRFTILWEGRDGGRQAASGVYYCRMTATSVSGNKAYVTTARLLLVK